MGRAKNFIVNKHFRFGVEIAACTVEEYQYECKPKSGSGDHASPLVGHLKRKHSNLYFEAVKEEKKTSRSQI